MKVLLLCLLGRIAYAQYYGTGCGSAGAAFGSGSMVGSGSALSVQHCWWKCIEKGTECKTWDYRNDTSCKLYDDNSGGYPDSTVLRGGVINCQLTDLEEVCTDSCPTANDNKCTDDATSQDKGTCPYGSDCSDCNPRPILVECEGDCRHDTDCNKGLQCFHRHNKESVPGCPDIPDLPRNRDYCYNPDKGDPLKNDNCSDDEKCNVCEGPCKKDEDCRGGLSCFQRGDDEVPGCGDAAALAAAGIGSGVSVCYSPREGVDAIEVDKACKDTNTCLLCQGDCDEDADCVGDLVCYQRSTSDPGQLVPGCAESEFRLDNGLDFCISPEKASETSGVGGRLRLKSRTVPCSKSKPCDVCEGHCENDDDCKGYLFCYDWSVENGEYDEIDIVLGCEGTPGAGENFCTWATENMTILDEVETEPYHNHSFSMGRCKGDCDHDDDCAHGLACFQRDDGEEVPGCEITHTRIDPRSDICYDPYWKIMSVGHSCSSHSECQSCQGPCDNDDECAGHLVCTVYDGGDLDGCSAYGAVSTGVGMCHAPKSNSFMERYWPNANTKDCSPTNRCPKCYGDCNTDNDCIGDLRCFQRRKGMKVPGCVESKDGHFADDMDFCYDPYDAEMYHTGDCSKSNKCEVCQGGCSEDKHCKGDLQCFHRHADTPKNVPGCDYVDSLDHVNFCYLPSENNTLMLMPGREAHEDLECTEDDPCPICRGDCDKDIDCAGDLKCFIRHDGEHVPGCGEVGFVDDRTDFCYNATDSYASAFLEGDCTSFPCKACQGPCANDNECEGDLTCQVRTAGELVEGCVIDYSGAGGITNTTNICAPFPADREAEDLGSGGCTKTKPCQPCQGDCDTDEECDGVNNKCWQRSNSNRDMPPGCNKNIRTSYNTDFCYEE